MRIITPAQRAAALKRTKPLPADWRPHDGTLIDKDGSRVQSAQSVHGREKWHADIPPAAPRKAQLKVSRR